MSQENFVTLPSVTGVDVRLRIAGAGTRSYAFVIDWHVRVLLALAWLFTSWFVLTGSFGSLFEELENQTFVWVVLVPTGVLYLFYHPIVEVAMRGRTPGKRIAGVRLVNRQGDVPSMGAILLRNVFRIVDSLPAAYLIGLLCVMFSAHHVRLGDMAAGTLLVTDDADHEASLHQASSAKQSNLSPQAIELLQELLQRWKTLDRSHREALARKLIASLDPSVSSRALLDEGEARLRARLESLLAHGHA